MRDSGRLDTIARWLPALTWMAMIFWLSSRSALPPTPGISYTISANLGHFLAYFTLTVLVLFALGAWRRLSWQMLAVAGTLALLYGISDEVHQSFVPGRDASIADLAIDAVGIACALGSRVVWWRRIAAS